MNLSVPPAENVTPESLLNKFCGKLSHPLLFPTRKFGFQFNRELNFRRQNSSINGC